jgi:hypothetical protein
MKERNFPWDEGQPTKPDVDALIAAHPPGSIMPGEWRITDDEVRALIGRSDEGRFKTVTDAWRRRMMNDHRVIIYRERHTGFYCPTPEQVFANTHPTLQSAGRKIGKQLRGISAVKPESEVQRSVQDHHGRLLYVTKRELRKARMNVLPSTAAAETPKILPPK